MTVENTNPIQHFTANGETTVFAISFAVEGKDNIKVTVNGSVVSVNDYIYDALTKAVVFNAAPEDGVEVIVERVTSLDRSINYQTYDNSFRPETLNYDLDRIWHVLQEDKITDAEILGRIKDEIEWRRTHNTEWDLLAQAREKGLFNALKSYMDAIGAMSVPNLFDGITDNVVITEEGVSQRVTNRGLKQAQAELLDALNALSGKVDTNLVTAKDYTDTEKTRAMTEESRLTSALNAETSRAVAAENSIRTLAQSISGGYLTSKDTLAELLTVTGTVGQVAKVMNDGANSGDYRHNGTTWVKGYSPEDAIKTWANANPNFNAQVLLDGTDFNTLTSEGVFFTASQPSAKTMLNLPLEYQLTGALINTIMNKAVQNGIPRYAHQVFRTGLGTAIERYCVNYVWRSWKPILDSDNVYEKIIQAVSNDSIVGIISDQNTKQRDAKKGMVEYTGSGTIIPILTDKEYKVLLGVNKNTGEVVGNFTSSSGSSTTNIEQSKTKALSESLRVKESGIKHFVFYGQSLSVGATATTILSSTQPYQNITFDTGPKMNGSTATATKPLVEDAVSPAPDGGSNRGETPCSGAANTATMLAYRDNGIDPSNNIIFSSTAGRGGTTIAALSKGSSWYSSIFINHVNRAKELVGASYSLPVMAWVQGEQDAANNLDYASYKTALNKLQVDVETDVKAITGQASPIHLLTYQMSYRAISNPQIAQAQYDVANENAKVHLVTPTYIFPHHAGDKVHLTSIGYKWMGAYYGRAYKELVHDNIEPRSLKVLSATVKGAVIKVKFDVPQLPLRIDTTTLAPTTNFGFKVTANGQEVAIKQVRTNNEYAELELYSTPTGELKVRYGLDYLGTGLTILNGGSGNICDSTTETITINGEDKPMFYIAPHFELKVQKLEI